jgi:hypothetical protein
MCNGHVTIRRKHQLSYTLRMAKGKFMPAVSLCPSIVDLDFTRQLQTQQSLTLFSSARHQVLQCMRQHFHL